MLTEVIGPDWQDLGLFLDPPLAAFIHMGLLVMDDLLESGPTCIKVAWQTHSWLSDGPDKISVGRGSKTP